VSDDCIGCGYCCHKAPCAIGQRLHGNTAPCPELHFAGGRHWCRWVIAQELKQDEAEGIMAKRAIDVDGGCCSGLNSWRREPIVDRTDGPNMQRAPRSFMELIRQRMQECGFQEVALGHPPRAQKEGKT
jgi:hypothetical protein